MEIEKKTQGMRARKLFEELQMTEASCCCKSTWIGGKRRQACRDFGRREEKKKVNGANVGRNEYLRWGFCGKGVSKIGETLESVQRIHGTAAGKKNIGEGVPLTLFATVALGLNQGLEASRKRNMG